MDLVGIAAVIGALSALVVSLTGIVVAFRVVSPQGKYTTRSRTDDQTTNTLPPQPGKPPG